MPFNKNEENQRRTSTRLVSAAFFLCFCMSNFNVITGYAASSFCRIFWTISPSTFSYRLLTACFIIHLADLICFDFHQRVFWAANCIWRADGMMLCVALFQIIAIDLNRHIMPSYSKPWNHQWSANAIRFISWWMYAFRDRCRGAKPMFNQIYCR